MLVREGYFASMLLARIYLVACVLFWGWSFVAAKISLKYMSPIELIGLRFLIALPFMAGILLWKKVPIRFNRSEWLSVLAGSAILGLHFFIQMTGLKFTSATNTGWIISVTPLVMAILAYLFYKERIGRAGVLGILIATIGILLLVSRGDLGSFDWISSTGDWLVLASAHTWALYTIAIRGVLKSRHPLAISFAVMLPPTLFFTGYMFYTSDWAALLAMPTDGIVATVYLGIFAMALGHWFWQEGVATLGAARAGIFLYLEPLATTLLAIPLLDESFGPIAALGGALVLSGVYIAQRKRLIKPTEIPPEPG